MRSDTKIVTAACTARSDQGSSNEWLILDGTRELEEAGENLLAAGLDVRDAR